VAREAYPATVIASGQIDRLLKNMVFPDYSKLLIASMPDISKLAMASLPETSKLIAASLPDVSKLAAASIPDMSKLALMKLPDYSNLIASVDTGKLFGDYAKALSAAAAPASILSSVSMNAAFPDYSKVFSGLDNLSVFRQYKTAMPSATQAAETLLLDEVLPEAPRPAPGQDLWDWIVGLPTPKKHQLAQKLGPAISGIVGLAGVALGQNYLLIAGMSLALASAFYAILLFVMEEIESRRNSED
jgi:hypothetical protein